MRHAESGPNKLWLSSPTQLSGHMASFYKVMYHDCVIVMAKLMAEADQLAALKMSPHPRATRGQAWQKHTCSSHSLRLSCTAPA